jgi:ABC-type multidrug transport system ATPase subunit
MSSPAILVENVEKYFPPALAGWRGYFQPLGRATERALAGVSFEVGAGESVAIVGPNGAGKSTLLRILATLLIPTSGRAALCGCDVERNSAGARAKFGYYTGGDDGFYGRLSARENLEFFAVMNNQAGAEISREIRRIAEWIGLAGALDSQVRTYSTGMIHRLGLVRALLHRPGVLLLDEPTRSLDPIAALEFRRFLRAEIVQRRGTTLLFASHTLHEVEEIADRVIVLSEGRVAASGSPAAIARASGAGSFEEAIALLLARANSGSEAPR